MLKLQTPVNDGICRTGISYDDRILMLGSCFSDNIGKMLSDYGFDVCINPFGTLYNPMSVLNAVKMIAGDSHFGEDDCVQIGAGDERWCSFHHHTSFARDTKEDFIRNSESSLMHARTFFASCSKVVITLGTSWCFRHVERNMIVSNCLKRPASEFVRERLSVSETADTLNEIMRICRTAGPDRFIFTVSPIRHLKDGAHGNQLSKSTLLIGIDEAINSAVPDVTVDYFPSYEIVNDELRDYRFYAEDMCHPTSQTTGYIRDRFLKWALPESERPKLEEHIRQFRYESHIRK